MTLSHLETMVEGCTSCALHESRSQIVFGEGADDADFLIVGEAPGANEDDKGRPFVGQSGDLLRDNLDQAGIDDVYITNTVKCRPPDNRDPKADEKESCEPYLETQIDLIEPELILSFGRHASEYFLGSIDSMKSVIGDQHASRHGTVMPFYHPAYILRQRSREGNFCQRLKEAYQFVRHDTS